MKWKKWLENWDMTTLKINTIFLEMEWNPSEPDKEAAWDLYVELLTRVATQNLELGHGDEKTALNSVFSLFAITRGIIKSNGKDCIEFTKIAVIVLNQKIRPFTSKWHETLVNGGFDDKTTCEEFRNELKELQSILMIYTKMLADMAGVEDLTGLEE